MRFFLLVFLLFFISAGSLQASEVQVTSPDEPYAVVPLSNDLSVPQYWLGALEGFPLVYGIQLDATSSLQLNVRQQRTDEPLPLALMIVRQDENGGGVSEVKRYRPAESEWLMVRDKEFGMTFHESGLSIPEIGPGEYRIEVSTPVNEGKYLLTVGQGPSQAGYFETLKNTRTTQQFFGRSIFSMLSSPYTYYPVGILLLVIAFVVTWSRRHNIAHVD